ncbi:MAG: FmdB family zinc ribbon protein [Planctomycetota bacterium]
MPIYEYECQDCRSRFELLVRDRKAPTCPSCASAAVDKQYSTFGVGGESARASTVDFSPGACGTCGDPRGPGSCRMDN